MASKKTKDEDVRKCATRNCKELPYATRAKYCREHAAERRAESLKAGSLAFRERKAAGNYEVQKRLLYNGELTKDALANPKKYLGQAKKLIETLPNYFNTLQEIIERQSQENAAAKLEKSKAKKGAKELEK